MTNVSLWPLKDMLFAGDMLECGLPSSGLRSIGQAKSLNFRPWFGDGCFADV